MGTGRRGWVRELACLTLVAMLSLPSVAQTPAQSDTPTRPEATERLPDPDSLPKRIPLAVAVRAIASSTPPLLVDVREAVEFDVSHIAGAMRLAPDADQRRAVTLATIVPKAEARDVFFYCTTSQRSFRIAAAFYHDLIEAGAKQVLVIDGGIIGWANEGLALVDGRNLPTARVHTSDREGALLLRDPARAVFGPAP